jgi:hypothetical protein
MVWCPKDVDEMYRSYNAARVEANEIEWWPSYLRSDIREIMSLQLLELVCGRGGHPPEEVGGGLGWRQGRGQNDSA